MFSSLKLIITCGFYKKFNSIAINSIHLKNQLCFYFLPLLQTSQKNIIVLFLVLVFCPIFFSYFFITLYAIQ